MESLYHEAPILDPGMMEHCKPGDIQRLPRSLNYVENAYHDKTTQADRDRVDEIVKKLKHMPRRPGPEKGHSNMPHDFPEQVRKAYETQINAIDSNIYIGKEDVLNVLRKQPRHKRLGLRTFDRWLEQSTGHSWKHFKKLLLHWVQNAPDLPWEQFKMTC